MKQNYTPNKLVKLIYGEADLFERLEIEDTIENDSEVRGMYLSFLRAIKRLPKLSLTPSKESVNNILFYSSVSTLDVQPMR